VVESLGDLGILVLMFLAGLELDLDEFQANRRAALTFGAFTFTIPFALGALLVLPFGYGLATALLFGSLWASHTLVAYPIVQERGLLRDRAVGVAGGGTVMTDTLALSVLAVVAGSVESDARPAVLLIEVALGLVLLAAFCGLRLAVERPAGSSPAWASTAAHASCSSSSRSRPRRSLRIEPASRASSAPSSPASP
jgi:Kef-type K+ transport system membrane component KefB